MGNVPALPAPQGPANNIIPAIRGEMTFTVHSNVSQEVIVITADRAHRCVRDWSDNIAERNSWQSPVFLFFSFLFTFVTTDFHDAFGVKGFVWQAVTIILMLWTICWSIKELRKLWGRGQKSSVDEVISELKRGAIVRNMDATELATQLSKMS